MKDIILTIHLLILACIGVTVLLADKQAFGWMRGKRETLDAVMLARLHRIVLVGLAGMIITGLVLFYPMRTYLLHTPAFYIKMAFVLALVVNGRVIGRFMNVATVRPFSSLTKSERMPLFISGAVSGISWVGAVIAAFFFIP